MCLPPCTAELPAVLSQLCPPRWMRMARVTSRWICLRIHRLSRAHSTASGTLSRRSLRTELEGSPRSARDDFAPGARWLTTGVDLQRLTPPMLPRLGGSSGSVHLSVGGEFVGTTPHLCPPRSRCGQAAGSHFGVHSFSISSRAGSQGATPLSL